MNKDLEEAIYSNNIDLVERLLKKGIDPNKYNRPNTVPKGTYLDTETPLIKAVQQHKYKIAQILLFYGADPNAQAIYGKSALGHASVGGKETLVTLLLNSKANPNIMDVYGWTPLHCSAMNGYLSITKCLLEFGAKTDYKTDCGSTPKDIAKKYNNNDIVDLFDLYEQPLVKPARKNKQS